MARNFGNDNFANDKLKKCIHFATNLQRHFEPNFTKSRVDLRKVFAQSSQTWPWLQIWPKFNKLRQIVTMLKRKFLDPTGVWRNENVIKLWMSRVNHVFFWFSKPFLMKSQPQTTKRKGWLKKWPKDPKKTAGLFVSRSLFLWLSWNPVLAGCLGDQFCFIGEEFQEKRTNFIVQCWWLLLSFRASSVCSEGQIFSAVQSWGGVFPRHPRCRCLICFWDDTQGVYTWDGTLGVYLRWQFGVTSIHGLQNVTLLTQTEWWSDSLVFPVSQTEVSRGDFQSWTTKHLSLETHKMSMFCEYCRETSEGALDCLTRSVCVNFGGLC